MFVNTARVPYAILRGEVTSDDTPLTSFAFADWPSENIVKLYEVPLHDASGLILAFHGSDAAGEIANYKLYGRARLNGMIELLLAGVITLGTQNCTTDPITGATITNGEWADTVSVTGGILAGIVEILDSGNNRICMLKFDQLHIDELYLEIDIPASGQVASIYGIITGW